MNHVWVNGVKQTDIATRDRGLQYGDGLFETMAVIDGTCPWLEHHYQRLAHGCEVLALPIPDKTILLEEIRQVVTGYARAVIKIIITSGSGGRGYRRPAELQPSRIVMLLPWPDYPSPYWQQGIRVYSCQTQLSCNPSLAGIKHLNRLEQVLARNEWQGDDYAEGLMQNSHGNVIEGTMSNVFMVHNAVLHTPELRDCGVDGIARRRVLDIAMRIGLETKIGEYTVADIQSADEVMLSNSLIGIWPVREYNNVNIGQGPVYQTLLAELVKDYPIINA